MAYTIEDLKAKKVADLRDIARDIEHNALQGYSSMRKDELIDALGRALGLAVPGRRAKKVRPAAASGRPKRGIRRIPTAGLDRPAIKGLIRGLKRQRSEALADSDQQRLREIRRQMHQLKRESRVAPVPPPATPPQEEAAAAE